MKKIILVFRELGAGARAAVDAARRLCPVVAGQLVEQHSLAITIFWALSRTRSREPGAWDRLGLG